jgi:hypothetical protein
MSDEVMAEHSVLFSISPAIHILNMILHAIVACPHGKPYDHRVFIFPEESAR